jgi:hypothetical protein
MLGSQFSGDFCQIFGENFGVFLVTIKFLQKTSNSFSEKANFLAKFSANCFRNQNIGPRCAKLLSKD